MRKIRTIKDKQIVFCEDSKSLKIYLQELWKIYKDFHKNTDFMIENPPTNGDYVEIINSSINKIKQLEKEQKIKFKKKYLIVDIDKSRENKTQEDKFQKMVKIAKENNINLKYCDPNFELYLLLHFENCCLQDLKKINEKLIKYINKEYSKSINTIDEVKRDNSIFKKICSDEKKIRKAIEYGEYNIEHKDNKTNLQDIIKIFINYKE